MKTLRAPSGSGPTAFARAVREGLRGRGLGLREFCREVGLDPSFFSKVLSGKRSPPWDDRALRRVAAALGIDPPRLFVAAGRIPAEWERLSRDAALFDRVHQLAAGRGASAMPSAPAVLRPSRQAPVRSIMPPRAFGEELL